MKKLYLLAITFVIAGLMITSATSISVTSDPEEQIAQNLPCQRSALTKLNIDNTAGNVAPLFAGLQITAGEFDEYRPSIAVDTSGRIFIGLDFTEDGSIYYPVFGYTEDEGTTWSDFGYWLESAGAKKPDVDFKTGGFYGTFSPSIDADAQAWIIDARDLTNILGGPWDFTGTGIEDFEDIHIGTYVHAGPVDDGAWNFGGLAFTGYNGYGTNDIEGCPYVLYQYDAEGGGVIGWLTNAGGCKHASNDIDQVTNMSYSVYDREVTGQYQLLVRKDNFATWVLQGDYYSHPLVTTKQISGAGNLTYPDVVADSNNVIVVAQTDDAGNQDIICYYSTNGMNAYNNVIVANGAEDELYPQIAWIKPGVAVCTYIRGTEAYYKATEDGGATWSAEARVSDEQLSPIEDHALTIAGINGNAYAIWQDGRNANVDIYFDKFYNVESPNVQIGTIDGGIGKVTMTILNTGTGAATDIDWSISVKGGILGRINVTTTGNIASLAAGGSQTVQTDKFIFGLGALTIQLSAGQATASKTGKVLFILVRNIA